MAEQQVENTQESTVTQQAQTEQVQNTVQTQTEQTQEQASVDLSKVDPTQLTPEQVAELQKGYLRNADYTQKTQELAAEKDKLTNYDALIQRPDFIQWAANKQAQVQQTQPPQTQEAEDEKVAAMTEAERVQYYVQKHMQPIAQSYAQDKKMTEDRDMKTKYTDQVYSQYVPKIDQMQYAIAKQPYIYREEAFKILDYDSYGKRAFEAGRQEGLKGQQQRSNANMTEGNAPSTTQREVITGPDAMKRIWDRNIKEGRTA